jgi:two-component system response regulator ChvI
MEMMDTSLFPPTTVSNRKNESPDLRSTDAAPRIVIVHPADTYRAALVAYLRAQGYTIEEFEDSKSAFECIIGDTPVDTILIDVDPPQTVGIDLFLRLRNLGVRTPIALFATEADQSQEDRALEQGAAEYFSKSRRFSIVARRLGLLVDGARAKTTLAGSAADVISIGALDVKLRCHRASWRGHEVPLTVTEFKIVRLLACRMGEQISYREIYDMVHGSGFFAGEGPQGYRINVRSLIRKIRDRFRTIDPNFIEIENCAGFGYRWRGPERDMRVANATEYMHWHPGKPQSGEANSMQRGVSPETDAPSDIDSLRRAGMNSSETKISVEG